jgi:hypothetical protein
MKYLFTGFSILTTSLVFSILWWRWFVYKSGLGGINILRKLELSSGEKYYDLAFCDIFIQSLFLVSFLFTLIRIEPCPESSTNKHL